MSKKADVVIYDRLVNKRYLDFAKEEAELIYVGKASSCHSLPQDQINQLIVNKAKEGKIVVRLKGGDPYLLAGAGKKPRNLRKRVFLLKLFRNYLGHIGSCLCRDSCYSPGLCILSAYYYRS